MKTRLLAYLVATGLLSISGYLLSDALLKNNNPISPSPVPIATTPLPAIKNKTIRDVDFRNRTYKNYFDESVMLKDGKFVNPDNAVNETILNSVQYVDFDNDGEEESVVNIGTSNDGSTGYGEVYYVYSYLQGNVNEIFSTGRENPDEMKIEGNSIDGHYITIKAPHWQENDPHCCPSQREEAIYSWKDGKIQIPLQIFSVNSKSQAQQEHEVIYPVCGSGLNKDYTPNTEITKSDRPAAISQRIGNGCGLVANDLVGFASFATGDALFITNMKCGENREGWYFLKMYDKNDKAHMNFCGMIDGEFLIAREFNYKTHSFSEQKVSFRLDSFIPLDYTPQP